MKSIIMAVCLVLVLVGIGMAEENEIIMGEELLCYTLPNGCPDWASLDCHNGKCCPPDHPYYCGGNPQGLVPRPCLNLNQLSDEQVKWLSGACSPFLKCN